MANIGHMLMNMRHNAVNMNSNTAVVAVKDLEDLTLADSETSHAHQAIVEALATSSNNSSEAHANDAAIHPYAAKTMKQNFRLAYAMQPLHTSKCSR